MASAWSPKPRAALAGIRVVVSDEGDQPDHAKRGLFAPFGQVARRAARDDASIDNASDVDIVEGMDTTLEPERTPPLSRTAMHILFAIGPEERHGYAIMHEVARLTDGAIQPGPGAVYTTLRRLLDDGLIEESDERPDPELDDQRRRYYRLTALGRTVAAAEARRMDKLVRTAREWVLEAGA